ncbi:MAG TPA: tRNA (guanosine(37)-N1)-methyltransferase TrmD [Steroidobacteraceae bacterium]|nr:tRNA (guanosine(37)-N1)-methyltransferase TrmD [Steroidobacteraceae bacterium]
MTLFPELVRGALEAGVTGRAVTRGLVSVGLQNPRDHATDAHRSVDDRPYGGGPGMVMMIEPLRSAIRAARTRAPQGSLTVYLSAQGRRFDQACAVRYARLPGLILVAGRYEGVDERLIELEVEEELSIGDYVLSGGELPALTVIDVVTRLLPGVLGDAQSAEQDSFVAGFLDWPHYTRPEDFEGRTVPPVLVNGNHAAIRRWRLKEALGRTWQRRPELLAGIGLTAEQRELLREFIAENTAEQSEDAGPSPANRSE